MHNVPRSLRSEGHSVLSQEKQADGTYLLLIEKEGARDAMSSRQK